MKNFAININKIIQLIVLSTMMFISFCGITMTIFAGRILFYFDKFFIEFLTLLLFLVSVIIIKDNFINWEEFKKLSQKEKLSFAIISLIIGGIILLIFYFSIHLVYDTNLFNNLAKFLISFYHNKLNIDITQQLF